MKKKVLAMVLTAVCAMGLMAGCGNSGNAATGTQNAATESGYKVGISQFAEHGSLDNCREGFLEGLKEEGIEEGKNLTVDYQNAQTDTGTASTIADSFVSAKDDLRTLRLFILECLVRFLPAWQTKMVPALEISQDLLISFRWRNSLK